MNTILTENPGGLSAAATARARLRQAADELVGEVFYGTLLRQMRASPMKGKYGHGGRGEEVFQAQLDQQLATRAGRARGGTVADALVARFERRAQAVAAYREQLQARQEALAGESLMTVAGSGKVEG